MDDKVQFWVRDHVKYSDAVSTTQHLVDFAFEATTDKWFGFCDRTAAKQFLESFPHLCGLVLPNFTQEDLAILKDWNLTRESTAAPNPTQDAFTSGAVRDTSSGKPRPDLISPHFTLRLAECLASGAEHYGSRNWEKGIPISRCYESLTRHLLQWSLGDDTEDHLAHAAFNLMAIIHFDSVGSDEMKDHPRYPQVEANRKLDKTLEFLGMPLEEPMDDAGDSPQLVGGDD